MNYFMRKPKIRALQLAPYVVLALLSTSATLNASGFSDSSMTSFAVRSACEKNEHWEVGENIPSDAFSEFTAFLTGHSSVARSLSEAIAYRRDTPPGEAREFSEYWIARTLMAAGLPQAAQAGFSTLVMKNKKNLPVELAALACMNRLVESHPALELPEALAARMSEFHSKNLDPSERTIAWNSATLLLKQQIQRDLPHEEIHRTVGLTRGGGSFERFAQGSWAALNGDHAATAAEMERFLSDQNSISSRVPELDKHVDHARLLVARAYYGMKKFEAASRQFKLIRKSSNEFPESLSELAWSTLSNHNYGETIGAALSLQAGGLRRVFAPEGPMVVAMAMNELCQYPESLKAVDQFRNLYEPSYKWLSEWNQKKKKSQIRLYPQAVAFLQKKKGMVTDRVATEWLRSPWFLASQDQLNLLVDESAAVTRVSRAGSAQQKLLSREVRKAVQAVLPRLRAERARGLSPKLRADIKTLLAQVTHYRRFRAAGPMWRELAFNQQRASVVLRHEALDRIERDLGRRNQRMLAKLQDVAENNRLIEVEIYDGASQDLIWQNANPDYRQRVKTMTLATEDKLNAAGGAKVWKWGHGPINSNAWTEIWEDELGTFKSNLANNCSNKEKYLSLKKELNRPKKG